MSIQEEIHAIMTIPDEADVFAFEKVADAFLSPKIPIDTISEETRHQIKLLLVCHFMSMRYRQLDAQRIGDESDKFSGKTGMYLDASLYGQQAIMLDPTGALADANKPAPTLASVVAF